ncbi:MAG: sigma-54-dependent Fis family transcriptional regulator [Candidatus Eisenbacteria bacterium]|nr:sigma-54-dependent Fis family transcriptional regulator [Candidatus Eisenbacteria bacterium]
MSPRVLVVDDEKNIRRMLTIILESEGYALREAGNAEDALAMLAEEPAELVMFDVGLPGMSGIEALQKLRATDRGVAVLMISGHATVGTAVEATRLGAFDFLEKPLSKDRVLLAVRNALQASLLGEQLGRHQAVARAHHEIVGDSAPIRALLAQVAKVAPTGATVLLTGESGTGKELFARALHDGSPRARKPFIKVNCAAIPEELIETELFGCVKGAYTGADRSRDGKFQQADTGTLFLDEIGDMSLRVQAKVLRALQEGEIERVGDSRVTKVDVRVLAATNKSLPAEVEAGRFREDLFFRLSVIPLEVPPLRDRASDVPALARHFLRLWSSDNELPARTLSAGASAALGAMRWRGNVRELRNVIERLAILTEGAEIGEEAVRALAGMSALAAAPASAAAAAPPARAAGVDDVRAAGGLVAARRDFERRCIEAALDATGGNVSQAAQMLMIERSNLHKKMQALGLEARPQRPGSSTTDEEDE